MVTIDDLSSFVPDAIDRLTYISRMMSRKKYSDTDHWQKLTFTDAADRARKDRPLTDIDSFAALLVSGIEKRVKQIKSSYMLFTVDDPGSFVGYDFTEFKAMIESDIEKYKNLYNEIMADYGLPQI